MGAAAGACIGGPAPASMALVEKGQERVAWRGFC